LVQFGASLQEMNDVSKEIYKRPSSITQDLQRFVTGKGNIAQAKIIFPEIPISFWKMLENFATQKAQEIINFPLQTIQLISDSSLVTLLMILRLLIFLVCLLKIRQQNLRCKTNSS